jgi:hypothetical protein
MPDVIEVQFAADQFRLRTQIAGQLGFAAGFPNFYFAPAPNGGEVGGTILIQAPGAVWRDVPLAELCSPSLDDFSLRMRATQDYAGRAGFVGGFPTFFHADSGDGIVCGTVLLTAEVAEWRDVPLDELANPPAPPPRLDQIDQRFKGTQDYAGNNGFVGGFPNMYHAEHPGSQIVCGTILLRAPLAQWQDVVVERLH